MNRRDFLKLIGTAATLVVAAKPLSAVQAVTPPELLLRPSYLAWFKETELHTLFWLVAKVEPAPNSAIKATLGSWAEEEEDDCLDEINLCFEKTELPKDKNQRLAVLLELQAQHPWTHEDWTAAWERARRARDDRAFEELNEASKKEVTGWLPRVYSPEMLRKGELDGAERNDATAT